MSSSNRLVLCWHDQVKQVQFPKSKTCFKKKRSTKRIPRGRPKLLGSATGSTYSNQLTPSLASSRLICRQFWKAGHHSIACASKPATHQHTGNHLHVHPEFLHSNATSHKWAFGAIAELLDNAVDEIENGATYVTVDKRTDPRDGSPALLIQDDGGGMDPEAMRRCMSFGFSDKKLKLAIGQYGNGFKTSSMRLGADVIAFSCHKEMKLDYYSTTHTRKITQSVGLLSYTFLRRMGYDQVLVPMVHYELDASTLTWKPILTDGEQHFSTNLSMLLQWSPYSTEDQLLKQFEDIGEHGTKVLIYNLWLNNEGQTELDFDTDPEDIRICWDDPKLKKHQQESVDDHHIANVHHYSLRAYSSVLYLRAPQSFKILLRGRVVEHHSIVDDLKYPEFVIYRPQVGGKEEVAVTVILGFLKDAPHVNVHGFNVYHRNRLILPFWRVFSSTGAVGRGVVGMLEANFINPTHNKQDFERTSLFQKLEARLKLMTAEYWRLHCGLIGCYKEKSVSSKKMLKQPLHPEGDTCGELNVLDDNSYLDNIPGYRKEMEYSPRENLAIMDGHEEFGSSTADIQLVEDNQTALIFEDHLQDEEMLSLIDENDKLRSELVQYEKTEEELNLKLQHLERELEDAQTQYTRLLAEAEAI